MIKSILILTVFIFSLGLSFSQTDQIQITLEGQVADISGTTHEVSISNGDLQSIGFSIFNNTGSSKYWYITRKRITLPPAGWTDYLCWGTACYGAAQMPTNPWSTPAYKVVSDAGNGVLLVDINPNDLVNGSCQYRYYVGESTEIPEDSIDVLVSTNILSVKEVKSNTSILTTYPNPADDFLTINLQSNQTEGIIRIVDVLGKEVLEEKIIGSKKIDVEEFKNGVYVLNLYSGGISTTKRIVIRH